MTTIITIPGFLGHSKDWSFLESHFEHYNFQHLDILNTDNFNPDLGLSNAGKTINSLTKNGAEDKILIGYSLGGRLALHALQENPKQWTAAIIISANPGLQFEDEKFLRIQNDSLWAQRFLESPWDSVIEDWNRQEVFQGAKIVRNESDFNKTSLAHSLKGWSLGLQNDQHVFIKNLTIPILWITGENDVRFSAIAKKIELSHPVSTHCITKNAAHRVPWEQQSLFLQEVKRFIELVKKEKV